MSNAWKFTDGPNFETIKIVKFPCKCLRSVNPIKPGFKWIHTGMILWILCMLFWCTWAKRKWATPLGSHLFWQVLGQVKQKNIMTQNSTQQNKTSKCFWHLERLSLLMCPYFFLKKKITTPNQKKTHLQQHILGLGHVGFVTRHLGLFDPGLAIASFWRRRCLQTDVACGD